MHILLKVSSVAAAVLALGVAASSGCAAGADSQGTATGEGLSSGHGPSSTSTLGPQGSGGSTATGTGGSFVGSGGSQGAGGMLACAQFTKTAHAAPAAMLIVLDKSSSMNTSAAGMSKWASAQLAVIQAIDNDAFDDTSLGLVTFPDSKVPAPACLNGLESMVSCGFPVLPQVPLADSSTLKSSATSGVRHDIYNYLSSTAPFMNFDDGSPDYDALNSAYAALRAYPNVQKRIAVLVSDGGFSCTSLSSPQRPGYTDGLCLDWEEPDSVNALIKAAYNDPTSPIYTFIVGVPGSHSHKGEHQGMYAVAPYSMLLALSTYAVSGSPTTVDPMCDSTLMFQAPGIDPAHPCHIDLSGNTFNVNALADAIAKVRGQVLGCVYSLPTPPAGQTIDPSLVNVLLTLGGMQSTLRRRATTADDCTTTSGCWDYDANNQVVLLGLACSAVHMDITAKIDIEVGCKTFIH